MNMHTQNKLAPTPMLSAPDFAQIFSFFQEGVQALVGLKDVAHRYVFTNDGVEALYGAYSGSVIGHRADDFLSAENASEILSREQEVLRLNKAVRFVEQITVGQHIHILETIRFPYHDHAGAVIGVGYVALDFKNSTEGLDRHHQAFAHAPATDTASNITAAGETVDMLTGTWNRQRIEDYAKIEAARNERYGHPVSMVAIDLDDFKRFDSSHGSAAEYTVLAGFCDAVRKVLRVPDIFGHWGDDEFILLLPNTGRLNALFVAERIRTILANQKYPQIGNVTASFGIATHQRGESADQWIGRTRKMLYRAQNTGRNRIEVESIGMGASDGAENVASGFFKLVWHKAYESGHPVIDRQHRGLFDYINQLLSAVINGQAEMEVNQLANALIIAAIRHFRDEEEIIRACGFPESDKHHDAHQQLAEKALGFVKKYESKQINWGELFQFLVYDFVLLHLLTDDRKFFPYLSSAAVDEAASQSST